MVCRTYYQFTNYFQMASLFAVKSQRNHIDLFNYYKYCYKRLWKHSIHFISIFVIHFMICESVINVGYMQWICLYFCSCDFWLFDYNEARGIFWGMVLWFRVYMTEMKQMKLLLLSSVFIESFVENFRISILFVIRVEMDPFW